MPCNALSDSDFSVTPFIFPGSGSFAPQSPNLNIPFPDIDPADLNELFRILGLITPTGTLKPTLTPNVLNTVYEAINDVLNKFTPFLMLYKFFLPVLNLILCIIEVLCSISNPIKLIRSLRRLFRVCIPEFLALFPFFALIIMIISLLLLIIALIAYLIQRILSLIEIILANIITLTKATQRFDNDSIVAVVKKIGDLLCLLQNLFVIFGVIAVFIQIIKDILSLAFKIPPCDSSDSSQDGCCTPDVCPDFIKNNNTITNDTGNFLYYNEVAIDSGLVLPAGFAPLVSVVRPESWQFYDANLPKNLAFYNITHAYDLPPGNNTVFFPSGTTYIQTDTPSSTPYTISFSVFYNPLLFNITNDQLGARTILIKNAIVEAPPTFGVDGYNNKPIAPFNGTLNLIGGTITEANGAPIFNADGTIMTINQFFHIATDMSGIVLPIQGRLFQDVSYTFNINHDVLLSEGLITLGCVPDVSADTNFINSTIGAQFNISGENLAGIVDLLPDMDAAQACVTNALLKYRASISLESTNTFQTEIQECLNNLSNSTKTAIQATIVAGFSPYASTFDLDPTIQFTTRPIEVAVLLKESSGQLMTSTLPTDVAQNIAAQITANISLGNISPFTYDGYEFFKADITSSQEGNGTISVAFNNSFISTLNNPSNIDLPPSVEVTVKSYTFIKSSDAGTLIPGSAYSGEPRRDLDDVAQEGTNDRSSE